MRKKHHPLKTAEPQIPPLEISEESLEKTLLEQEKQKKQQEQAKEKEQLQEKYQALGIFKEGTVFYEAITETQMTPKEKQWLNSIQSKEHIRQLQLEQALKKDRQQSSWRRKRPSFVKNLWGKLGLAPRYRPFFVSLSIVLFLVSVIFLLPVFRMNTIEIHGLYQLTREQVLQVSGLKEGQHLLTHLGGNLESLLSLRYGYAEKSLQQNFTEIKSVKIYPEFPQKIRIDLEERVPLAYLKVDEAYAQMDKEGVVMKISFLPPKDAPVIVGKLSESIKTGQKINYRLRNAIGKAMLVLYEMLKLDESTGDGFHLIDQVEGIRILSRDDLLLSIKSDKVKEPTEESVYYVRFSTKDKIKEHVNWLRQSLRSKVFEKLGTGLIDISGQQKVFLPTKNILPYEREDLKVDELSFLTNPILIEEETLERSQKEKNSSEEGVEKEKSAP